MSASSDDELSGEEGLATSWSQEKVKFKFQVSSMRLVNSLEKHSKDLYVRLVLGTEAKGEDDERSFCYNERCSAPQFELSIQRRVAVETYLLKARVEFNVLHQSIRRKQ